MATRQPKELTHAVVRELLDYNPATGHLTWKHRSRQWFSTYGDWRRWNGLHEGRRAFTHQNKAGYHRGNVLGVSTTASRLAWFWMKGEWPHGEIDHKDHDTTNDRWRNLRDVTPAENNRNRPMNGRNSTGVTGVSKNKHGSFVAYLQIDKLQIHLGSFPSLEKAKAARVAAIEASGRFHPNHGRD